MAAKHSASGGGRKTAAARAATAAKASGDAAPVVAPLEYARVRHQQRRAAKDAAPARRSSGGEGPGARGGGGRAGGAGGPKSGTRGGGGGRSGGRAPAPGSARARLPRPRRAVAWMWSGNRRVLVAEFVLCVAILGAGWVVGRTDAAAAQAAAKQTGGKTEALTQSEAAVRVMVKASALFAVFFLLALVASGGKGAARVSTALGTLITAAYALTSPDVHAVASWAAQFYTKPGQGKAR